jgi:hypothetical protein
MDLHEELKDCLFYTTGEPECTCCWCAEDSLAHWPNDGTEPF